MRKHIHQIYNAILYIKRHSLVPLLFLFIMQIIISFSYIFFYLTVPQNTMDFISSFKVSRTLIIEFDEPTRDYSLDEIVSITEGNGISEIESYTFYFLYEEYPHITLRASTDLDSSSKMIATGTGISNENCVNYDFIAVKDLLSYDANESFIYSDGDDINTINNNNDINNINNINIGDEILINGIKFNVIGTKNDSFYITIEVPYTVGLEYFSLSGMNVILSPGLSDGQVSLVGDYLLNMFPNTVIKKAVNVERMFISRLLLIITTSIFSIIVSFINLCFTYKYIVGSMRSYFMILRTCGATLRKCTAIMLEVYLTIFTASYIIGILILTLLKYLGNIAAFNSLDFNLLGIVLLYLVLLLMIVAFIFPPVIRLHRHSIKESVYK